MSKHLAIATTALGVLEEIQVPTEKPGHGEVLIKNEFGAMIPFDGYQTDQGYYIQQYPMVLGFSAAGKIVEIGDGVSDLSVGDQVIAYTFGESKAKAVQQYSLVSRTVVGKVPNGYPLLDAVTFPDNFVTAFWTLFGNLNLPLSDAFPDPPSTLLPDTDNPILVYGASSSAGQYTLQLVKLSGYKTIIATASPRNHDLLRKFGATHVFDYNSSTLVQDIRKAAGGLVKYAIDPIAADSTLSSIAQVVGPGSKIAILLPVKQGTNTVYGSTETKMILGIPDETRALFPNSEVLGVATFQYQKNAIFKETIMPKILPQLLESRVIQPNRVKLLKDGTFKERVEKALDLFRNNKISGEKVVIVIPQ